MLGSKGKVSHRLDKQSNPEPHPRSEAGFFFFSESFLYTGHRVKHVRSIASGPHDGPEGQGRYITNPHVNKEAGLSGQLNL